MLKALYVCCILLCLHGDTLGELTKHWFTVLFLFQVLQGLWQGEGVTVYIVGFMLIVSLATLILYNILKTMVL